MKKLTAVLCLGVLALGGIRMAHAAVTPEATMPRNKIPKEYLWDLTKIFKSDALWKQGIAEVKASFKEFASLRGKLSDPSKLNRCLDLYFAKHGLANRVTMYANLREDSDTTDALTQAMNTEALALMADFMRETSFIKQEVLEMSDTALAKAYKSKPGLTQYKPYLDELRRRRARLLNPEAERVLSMAGDNLWAEIDLNELPSPLESAFHALLSDIVWPKIKDEKGTEVQLTLSNYPKYRASSDRRVRKEAVESFFKTIHRYEHVFATLLGGQAQFNKFLAQARNYPTAMEAYLDKDNLPVTVYTNLIEAVHANVKPLHRYVALRKKIMKLDQVHLYDLYPPLVAGVKSDIPYEKAVEMIQEALKPLGQEYLDVLAEGMNPKHGWVDVYPNKNKKSGAFSSSCYGVTPYVKMNYFNDFDDVSTLAHEYGHALHSHLTMKAQPPWTSRYTSFIAEIASTVNEILLSDTLIAKAKTPAEKLYLLTERLETLRTTIYRQTLFAEFELLIHAAAEAGTPITADLLGKTYGTLITKYYGPEYVMGPTDSIEWAYIPHLYYKFYVFVYATGLSSAIAIADRLQQGLPGAAEAYLDMLRGGSSKPPLELLKEAGVDLTKPTAVEAAAALFDKTITEIETLFEAK